jgi:hypothetical protein
MSQNPCFETFVTSTIEMGFPRVADFILMLQDQSKSARDAPPTQTVILRQLNSRLQPELRFTLCVIDMHVHPCLFREKK